MIDTDPGGVTEGKKKDIFDDTNLVALCLLYSDA